MIIKTARMRTLTFALLLMLTLLGCKEDQDIFTEIQENQLEQSFLATDTLIKSAITFNSQSPWTIRVQQDDSWLTLNKTTGSVGDQQIDLLMKINSTGEEREATITVNEANESIV